MIVGRNHGLNKTCIFNQHEFDDFINLYINQGRSFEEAVQIKIRKNSNFTEAIIVTGIKKRIREFILSFLEDDLYCANRISVLLMYDHDSDILFHPMIKILDIIDSEQKQNLIHCFKMMKMQGYALTNERNYHNVSSECKMSMYQSFVNFAKQNGLFEKVRACKIDPTQSKAPYEDISKVFPPRDQELVYRCFKNCNFDVKVCVQSLKMHGLHICGEKVLSNAEISAKLENMLLIGLYQAYKLIIEVEKLKLTSWEKFNYREILFDPYPQFYHILARIAIRKDPTRFEARKLAPTVGRRFIIRNQWKQQLRFSSLYNHIKKHVVMKRISNEMKQIVEKEDIFSKVKKNDKSEQLQISDFDALERIKNHQINLKTKQKSRSPKQKSRSHPKSRKNNSDFQDSFKTPTEGYSSQLSDFEGLDAYASMFSNDLSRSAVQKRKKRDQDNRNRREKAAKKKKISKKPKN